MKKIFCLCLVLSIVMNAFAENAKSAGLIDSDVSSFCKNFSKIKSELDKLGVDVSETESLVVGADVKSKAEKILNKYGISGSNSIEKLYAICYGYAVEYYDATLANNPQAAQMIKSMGKYPMAEFRKLVADSDRAVVKKYLTELTKVFDNDTP